MLCIILEISLVYTVQTVPAKTVSPDLNTIGVVLSAVGVVLGIISIALSIWLDRKNRKKN